LSGLYSTIVPARAVEELTMCVKSGTFACSKSVGCMNNHNISLVRYDRRRAILSVSSLIVDSRPGTVDSNYPSFEELTGSAMSYFQRNKLTPSGFAFVQVMFHQCSTTAACTPPTITASSSPLAVVGSILMRLEVGRLEQISSQRISRVGELDQRMWEASYFKSADRFFCSTLDCSESRMQHPGTLRVTCTSSQSYGVASIR